MNLVELFRLRLQSLVARGLGASEIAARVGLAAASEVWGGDEPRERPAWYLWLRGARGAWQLELVGAEALDAAAAVGRFTIRHYPSSSDPAFARFSPEERRIATEALDATGTPPIDLASTIPDALFAVGSIDWALDLDGDGAAFALASLDRLRTRSGHGAMLRDVPGWRLAAPVLSLLAGLHAQVERRAASRLVVSRQRGFELVVSDRGTEHRDSADAVQGEAVLLLAGPDASPEAGSRLVQVLRDPDGEVVLDASFAGRSRPAITADARMPLEVSEAWFGGVRHAEDRIACAC